MEGYGKRRVPAAKPKNRPKPPQVRQTAHRKSRKNAAHLLWNSGKYAILFCMMRHRQAVRQGTLTPPSQVRLLLAQLHKRPARKLRFSKSCRSFCVQKQEWGTASEPSPLEKHLAGVAFSCISQSLSPCRYHRRVAATKLTTSNTFLILCLGYHIYPFL